MFKSYVPKSKKVYDITLVCPVCGKEFQYRTYRNQKEPIVYHSECPWCEKVVKIPVK